MKVDKVAQPRRRSGWIEGMQWWSNTQRPIRLNLEHVVAIRLDGPARTEGQPETLAFDVVTSSEDGGETYWIVKTDDLLRQLEEEGL
jgi:hypothetical protein